MRLSSRTLRAALATLAGAVALAATDAAAAMACDGTPSAYSQQIQAQAGVAGYWRLDEASGTTACATAGGPSGAYAGGVTLGVPGLPTGGGTAARFDGSTGDVKVADAPGLRLGSSVSLEAWLKLNSLPVAGSNTRVLDKSGTYTLRVNDTGAVQFTTFSGGAGRSLTSAAGTVAAGKTYHLVGTYDGATMRLYVNGALATSKAVTGTVDNWTSPLYVGVYQGTQRFLDGVVDEVAVYSSALPAADVASHYSTGTAAGTGAPPTTPGSLSATGGDGTVALAWGASSDTDLAGYRIYRRNADGTWPATPRATTGASTTKFSDTGLTNGTSYTYRVTAYDAAGQESAPSAVASATPQVAATDPVIGAAGDVACAPTTAGYNGGLGTSTACRQAAVSDLLVGTGLSAVLALGDLQYDHGQLSLFQQVYDPTWGRVKSITRPAVGNHDYDTAGAQGYFDYFDGVGNATGSAGDRSQGYYSFDVGTWHLISLNSNCSIVSCSAGSAQETWLKADLAAHPNRCTLAYWHHPRFNSGTAGQWGYVAPLWQDLYNAGADVVLNGHDHHYERFAPQAPNGTGDAAKGIREFIVGTGGASHQTITATSFAANSEVRNDTTYGILRLTLHPGSYDWKFAPIAGQSFTDSGSTTCH